MDRMVPEPTTFKQLVEADLRRAARLIIKVQDELDLQFRIATPEGDYHLSVTLPSDGYEREAMLRRVATFMAWKLAPSFTLTCELAEPDCVCCTGISHHDVHACYTLIRREPRPWTKENFGPIEWLPRESIGTELLALLPRGARSISATELAMLTKWFGPTGRFPAVHLASGTIGDI